MFIYLLLSLLFIYFFFVVDARDIEVEDDNEDDDGVNEIKISAEDPLKAKDGTIWKQIPPAHHQTRTCNIVRQRSGPHRSTNSLSVIHLDAFSLLKCPIS